MITTDRAAMGALGRAVALGLILSLSVTGCSNKAQTGAGIGALGGALAGSLLGPDKNREQWALIGAAAGGLMGYAVGNEMDKADLAQLNSVYETSPSYKTTSWQNPDTGREYSVTPRPAYEMNHGRYCREAEIDSFINGRQETIVTTACRREDGRWEMQNGG